MKTKQKKSKNKQPKTLFNPKGAGRPRLSELNHIPHASRPDFKSTHPLHVTVKLFKENYCKLNLRNKDVAGKLKIAILRARSSGLRIIHFSLQDDHVHLIIESHDKKILARGMRAFGISFSKQLNTLIGATGRVYKERYHLHILKSLREAKHALHYVLQNAKKHKRIDPKAVQLDNYSTAVLLNSEEQWKLFGADFPLQEGWQARLRKFLDPPQSWFLTSGWMRVL